MFNVYSDLFNYKKGIYKPTTKEILGVHSVKVLGWGLDITANRYYWLV
jgi:hypothetical protein